MLSIFEIFDGELEERRRQNRAKGIRKSIKKAGEKKKQFIFFGAFNSQSDAKKKAKEVGGFVKESNGRFYVKKEK